MSVAHSPITNPNRDSIVEEQLKCPSCLEVMQPQGQECCIIETCQHVFHYACIEQALANSSECPFCKTACELVNLKKYPIISVESAQLSTQTGTIKKNRPSYRGKSRATVANRPVTRNLSRTVFSENLNVSNDHDLPTNNTIELVDESATQNNVNPGQNFYSISTAMQNQNVQNPSIPSSNEIDYAKINQMIENNIARILQNLSIGTLIPNQNNTIPSNNLQNNNSYQNFNSQQNFKNFNSRNSNSVSEESSSAIRPDRVTFIIQNWNIQFDGSCNRLSVDEFLYRVKTLTKEHLNNNFVHICKNLPILLNGKAREWYWRYHKSVESIEWTEFCGALRAQFKDLRSNFDLMESIRSRKMKVGESFDAFYDSICSIADRLKNPIPEDEMVEILIRNLRPEIRQELLYVPIFTIAHLRKLAQMRENLMNDEVFRKQISQKLQIPGNNMNSRRTVAEIQGEDFDSEEVKDNACVDALKRDPTKIKCWNCDDFGHFWDDCLKERSIFCYGCGSKNVYKPQCARCANKKLSVASKNFHTPHLHPNPP